MVVGTGVVGAGVVGAGDVVARGGDGRLGRIERRNEKCCDVEGNTDWSVALSERTRVSVLRLAMTLGSPATWVQ